MSLAYISKEVCSICHKELQWRISIEDLKKISEGSLFTTWYCPHCQTELPFYKDVSFLLEQVVEELEKEAKVIRELLRIHSSHPADSSPIPVGL